MGWCHEFGPQIREGCGHAMRAGEASCSCSECGVECTGRFDGCADVWRRRAQPLEVQFRPPAEPRPARSWPAASVAATDARGARVPRPASAGLPVAHVPAPPPSDDLVPANGSVADWLRETFEGLWSEFSTLRQTVAQHEVLLAKLAGGNGDQSLQALAESLPQRIEEIVSTAMAQRQAHLQKDVDGVVQEIRGSIDAVERSATELLGALEETFGDEFDDVAHDIRRAVGDAGRKVGDLTRE